MKTINIITTIFSLFLILSCSKKTGPKEAPVEPLKDFKLSVLSSRGLHLIEPLFKEFRDQTGVKIEASNNKAGVFFSMLKNKSANADLLLTTDIGSLMKASDEGLLEPVDFEISDSYPQSYISPKKDWFGLSKRTRVIFYNEDLAKKKKIDLDSISYKSLAESKYKDSLCLRTSQKVYNQALVADFVERFGEEETLKLLKGWVKNLAAPVFASDREVIKAVSKGKCLFGIANSYYLGKLEEKSDLENVKILWSKLTPAHVNLSGIGLIKGAPQKEEAQKLIKWLMSERAQNMFASVNYEYPVKPRVAKNELLKAFGEPLVSAPNYLKSYDDYHSKAMALIKKAEYK